MKKSFLYRNILLLGCLVILVMGCATQEPLHKQLNTRLITAGVISSSDDDSGDYSIDDKWQDIASGKVSEALQNSGFIGDVISSTTGAAQSAGLVASDTVDLKLVNRDKLKEIMEEKKKQHSTGAFEKARERMKKIYGLDLIVTVKLRNLSRSGSQYESEGYISDGISLCREIKMHSILNVEAIVVSNGEVVQTGEYEGTAVREKCRTDKYPSLSEFNLSNLKLESIELAAHSFGGRFRDSL